MARRGLSFPRPWRWLSPPHPPRVAWDRVKPRPRPPRAFAAANVVSFRVTRRPRCRVRFVRVRRPPPALPRLAFGVSFAVRPSVDTVRAPPLIRAGRVARGGCRFKPSPANGYAVAGNDRTVCAGGVPYHFPAAIRSLSAYIPRVRVVLSVAAVVRFPAYGGGGWLPQPRARSPLSVRRYVPRRNPARRRGRRGNASPVRGQSIRLS